MRSYLELASSTRNSRPPQALSKAVATDLDFSLRATAYELLDAEANQPGADPIVIERKRAEIKKLQNDLVAAYTKNPNLGMFVPHGGKLAIAIAAAG